MGDFRGALKNEKETYLIYKKLLGENHEKTKESSDCLRHLTNQAVVLQKKMNEIYHGNKNTIIPPIQIQPPSIHSVLELLNVINGILFLHISPEDMENIKEFQTVKSKSKSLDEEDCSLKSTDTLIDSTNNTDEATVNKNAKLSDDNNEKHSDDEDKVNSSEQFNENNNTIIASA